MRTERRQRWRVALLAVAAVALLWPAPAPAQEIDELRKELEAQKQRTADLENRINQLEARQRLKEKSTDKRLEQVTGQVEGAGAWAEMVEWAKRISISGDLRIRHEHIDSETVKGDGSIGWRNGRDRLRMRARLMFSAVINNEWDVAFRLASGQLDVLEEDLFPDPISANQTFTNFASSKSVWIDLAYFDYHPGAIEGFNFIGGKMKHPFLKVGKNQLMYDNDLNLEGLAATYALPFGDSTSVHVSGGGFWVDESSGGVDTGLFGVQGYLKQALGGPGYVLGGGGFYDYTNIKGKEDKFGILFGNTNGTIDPNEAPTWASDFDIFELFAEWGTEVGPLPVAIYGTWVNNTAAATDEDTGWLLGGRIGKAKDPGSWQFDYNYRDLERDAVLAVWADSDFGGGGTGVRGHFMTLGYQIAKNVQAVVDYFHNTVWRSGPDLDFRRLHAGVKLKF